MFIHLHKLRHLLTPECYISESWYRKELDHVLRPTWHFVATLGDLPRDGDYITLTLFDTPLLLRRIEGEVHAYLNVCPHRHCQLVSKPQGHDPRFRCQYHGWEYQCDGHTAKIPDAGSFRPWDRENACLKKYRTARAGELVFVTLSDNGVSLEEQLGPNYDTIAASYSAPFRQIWRCEMNYDANWKLPIENGVESYHIPCLHQKTFGTYPEEPDLDHELHETWSLFRTTHMDRLVRFGISWTTWWLGLPFTGYYSHLHVFPNLTFISLDTMRMAQIMVPTSATTSRSYVWVYAPYGPRRGITPWIYSRSNAWMTKQVAKRVLAEDAPIFPKIQRGLKASVYRGVIGRREERVYTFQEHVARLCGMEITKEDLS
jgi:phenylpropionate dioxygenase-like ring-hydroxylating dioxygenase large terminal subunit